MTLPAAREANSPCTLLQEMNLCSHTEALTHSTFFGSSGARLVHPLNFIPSARLNKSSFSDVSFYSRTQPPLLHKSWTARYISRVLNREVGGWGCCQALPTTPPCLITCTEDLLQRKEVDLSHNPHEAVPPPLISSSTRVSVISPFFSTRPNLLHPLPLVAVMYGYDSIN